MHDVRTVLLPLAFVSPTASPATQPGFYAVEAVATLIARKGVQITPPYVSLEWSSQPTSEQIRSKLPRGSSMEIQATLMCGLSKTKKITGCKIDQIAPDTPANHRAAQAIVPLFPVATHVPHDYADIASFVLFHLRVRNSDGKPDKPPCLPMWCHVEPQPPGSAGRLGFLRAETVEGVTRKCIYATGSGDYIIELSKEQACPSRVE